MKKAKLVAMLDEVYSFFEFYLTTSLNKRLCYETIRMLKL
jgi:hypothetical protein